MVHNQLGQTFGMAFMDLATGEELALKAPEFPISHEYGTTALQGIAQVQFDTLGAYSATVAGQIPGGDKLMVRRFDMVELIKGLVWGFVLIFLGFIAGPVMALVVLVVKKKNASGPCSPTSAPFLPCLSHWAISSPPSLSGK
jgi:hypothetical protein